MVHLIYRMTFVFTSSLIRSIEKAIVVWTICKYSWMCCSHETSFNHSSHCISYLISRLKYTNHVNLKKKHSTSTGKNCEWTEKKCHTVILFQQIQNMNQHKNIYDSLVFSEINIVWGNEYQSPGVFFVYLFI